MMMNATALSTTHASRQAPGPHAFDIVRTLLSLRRDPLATFMDAHARWGSVVRFPLGERTFFFVSSHQAARRVLCDNAANYTKDTWSYGLLRSVLGDGLLTSDGDAWRRQRRLAQPSFDRSKMVMSKITDMVTTRVNAMIDSWDRDDVIDVSAAMSRLTIDIVARAIFGVDISETDAELVGHHLSAALAHLDQRTRSLVDLPALWLPRNRRFASHMRELDAAVFRIIASRRRRSLTDDDNGGGDDDLLGALIRASRSDDEIKDEVKTFLAGHETTSNLLVWTLGLLALPLHRDAATRATEDAYASMVLKETMRLYPPLWLLERRALHRDVLDGCEVPERASIAICQYVMHRDANVFPDPEKWIPERFESTPRPRSYAPFGAGPRMCIGDAFGMAISTIVITNVMKRAHLELAMPTLPKPVALMTLRPRTPIRVRVCSLSSMS